MISACHGSGVCSCLPDLTRQVLQNVSDWRGNRAEVLEFEYGAPPASAPFKEHFRVRAAQGQASLMINLYNYGGHLGSALRKLDGAGFVRLRRPAV